MTMYFGDENKPSLESLALMHHGVKGMKWGVRRDRELEYHKSISEGKGNRRQRAHYAINVATLPELVKHKGDINAVAAARAAKLQKQKTRFESGNATRRDKLQVGLKNAEAVTPVGLIDRGKRKGLTQS